MRQEPFPPLGRKAGTPTSATTNRWLHGLPPTGSGLSTQPALTTWEGNEGPFPLALGREQKGRDLLQRFVELPRGRRVFRRRRTDELKTALAVLDHRGGSPLQRTSEALRQRRWHKAVRHRVGLTRGSTWPTHPRVPGVEPERGMWSRSKTVALANACPRDSQGKVWMACGSLRGL